MTEISQNTENITNISELKNHIPNIDTDSLRKYLQQRYGVEDGENILSVSQEELAKLINDLRDGKGGDDINEAGNLLYDEYIETKLEKDGIDGVSFDSIISGIENSRITDMKNLFESYIDKKFNYSFLSNGNKEILKISIVNNIINSQFSEKIAGFLDGFEGKIKFISTTMKKPSIDSISKIGEVFSGDQDQEKSSEISTIVESIIKPYLDKFDELDILLLNQNPKLSNKQKQNIVSNTDWFNNPKMMEAGTQGLDIKKIDLSKSESRGSINTEEIKKYLLGSREKIENLAKKFESGDKVMDMTLRLLSSNNTISNITKTFLDSALKLPILGNILAVFLGLDPDNSIGDLESNIENYKVFKSLKSLGASYSEGGKRESVGKGVFEDISLEDENFSEVKNEIKEIKKLNTGKLEDFWIISFSKNGFDVEGISIRFDITDDDLEGNKLKKGSLKDILRNGLKDYKEKKEENREQSILKQEKAKQEKIRKENKGIQGQITSLGKELKQINMGEENINWLLDGGVTGIPHWSDSFNIGDIEDIKLKDILLGGAPKNLEIIAKEIGKEDLDELNDSQKKKILYIFSLVRVFIEANKDLKYDDISLKNLFDYKNSNIGKKFKEFLEKDLKRIGKKKKDIENEMNKLGASGEIPRIKQSLIGR